MNRFVLLAALAFVLAACGGGAGAGSGAPPSLTPPPKATAAAASTTVAPNTSATTITLPAVAGYGGTMHLPAGSGSAILTLSVNAPTGVPVLTSLSSNPALMYFTFTAQSSFSLAAMPGFTLTVPATESVAGTYELNQYATSWSGIESVWFSGAALCAPSQGSTVSLQSGQSLTLAIDGDFVVPTPIGVPSPCPP